MRSLIKQHWDQLSSRDQRTLKWGGIVLGILCALRFIWWPLYSRLDLLRDEIAQEQSLIHWMIPRVSQILEAKQSGMAVKHDKSLPAFEKSLQQAGLKPYLTEFSQNAQGQVSVNFAEVPFESCMGWIEQVQLQGWLVQQLRANKGEKSGVVSIEVVLG